MIRNKLRQFMIGRYGPNQLNLALIILAIVIAIVERATGFAVLMILAYIVLILTLFRSFSKNLTARRKENDRFLRYWWPARQKISGWFSRVKSSKQYKFFKCPGCHNTLRLPRGKGKIQITCPRCGERFIKKT